MRIKELRVTIRDIIQGYTDNSDNDEGIYGYDGKLNIRPKYQRNYVYDEKKRNAVIDTVSKGFPLGLMYWVQNDDGTYEILDGQQRTISICTYINPDNPANGYSVSGLFGNNNRRHFSILKNTEQEKILDYPLLVYVCEDADADRLQWFETINIAGEKLSGQEIRNAQYCCAWLTDAKRYFSKRNSAAQQLATKPNSYIKLSADNSWNRQGGLEKVLRWYINDMKDTVKLQDYMSAMAQKSKADPTLNATELWEYFKSVIAWVKLTFPKYRKKMDEVEWGILYNKYHENIYNAADIEETVARLYADDDVTNKAGIYYYIFDGKEKHLHIRQFEDWQKETVYEKQNQKCADCGQHFEIGEMEAHHKKRWVDGGHTEIDNCVMLCKDCHDKRHNHSD